MRALLLALAAVFMPCAAAAQPASDLQRLVAWAQELTAAQQPAVDSYQQCSPLIMGAIELIASGHEPDDAATGKMIADMRACLAHAKQAGLQSRDALARMGPMPASFERALGVDSAYVLRQSIAATEAMHRYLERSEEAFNAAVAGDLDAMTAKFDEARIAGGEAMDGQILLLDTMRKGMPLESHKSLLDMRLAISRATRAVVVDTGEDFGALAAAMGEQGAAARAASARLRAAWVRDSKPMRDLLARIKDPKRQKLLARMDTAYDGLAGIGDSIAIVLEGALPATLDEPESLRILDRLSRLELEILQAGQTLAAVAAELT